MMPHSPSSGGIYIVKYWTLPPPTRVRSSFNFMQFWGEDLAKSYVGTSASGGLAPPPRGNPGSATA